MCKVVLYTHCSTQIVFKNLASKYLKLEKKKKAKSTASYTTYKSYKI